MSVDSFQPAYGDRNTLSADHLALLENKILPMALRWLDKPGLRHHGLQTLAYWGEPIPERHREAKP